MVVDANGNTVGQLVTHEGNSDTVILQINGMWVELLVDMAIGFLPNGNLEYLYESTDCTGQPYLSVNSLGGSLVTLVLPPVGSVVTVFPAIEPSINFAGTPTLITIQSSLQVAPVTGSCAARTTTGYVGLPQSVPVSSLGFTLPFSLQSGLKAEGAPVR
jgi:hypothetical protein